MIPLSLQKEKVEKKTYVGDAVEFTSKEKIIQHCQTMGIPFIVQANDLESNLAKMLCRMNKGSGIDGIAGGKEVIQVQSMENYKPRPIWQLSPLLGYTRDSLKESAEEFGIEDLGELKTDQLNYKNILAEKAIESLKDGDFQKSDLINLMESFSVHREELNSQGKEYLPNQLTFLS